MKNDFYRVVGWFLTMISIIYIACYSIFNDFATIIFGIAFGAIGTAFICSNKKTSEEKALLSIIIFVIVIIISSLVIIKPLPQ